MTNGRLWTVVNPNIAIPIGWVYLGLTSMYIHFQVMFQTDWFPAFLQGG
ncbi:MAG: light-harvesting protein [Myxococcota bacterium]